MRIKQYPSRRVYVMPVIVLQQGIFSNSLKDFESQHVLNMCHSAYNTFRCVDSKSIHNSTQRSRQAFAALK